PPTAPTLAPHSFPTRRSSDLSPWSVQTGVPAARQQHRPLTRLNRSVGSPRISVSSTTVTTGFSPVCRTSEYSAHHSHQAAVSGLDRKSTRLNSSHRTISYAVF